MDDSDIQTHVYKLTAWHGINYQLRGYFRGMTHWPVCLFWLPLFLGGPIWLGVTFQNFVVFLTFLPIMFTTWVVLVPALTMVNILLGFHKTQTPLGQWQTTLTADEVVTLSEGVENRRAWKTFRFVCRAGKDLHLVGKFSTGLVIPQEAFTDGAMQEAFIRKAEQHIKDTQHKPQIIHYVHSKEPVGNEGLSTPPFNLNLGFFVAYKLPLAYQVWLRPVPLMIVVTAFAGFPLWIARKQIIAGDWLSPLTGVLALLGAVLLLFPAASIVMHWFLFRKMIAAQQVVTINETGVAVVGPRHDLRFAWDDISNIVRRGPSLSFCNSAHGNVVVDRTAFVSKADADAFEARALALWRAVGTSTAVPPT